MEMSLFVPLPLIYPIYKRHLRETTIRSKRARTQFIAAIALALLRCVSAAAPPRQIGSGRSPSRGQRLVADRVGNSDAAYKLGRVLHDSDDVLSVAVWRFQLQLLPGILRCYGGFATVIKSAIEVTSVARQRTSPNGSFYHP